MNAELPAANVTRESSHFDVVSSVSDVSELFSTQFQVLVNNHTQQAVLRANTYTVPDHIDGHIAAIFGLHGLPLPPRKSIIGSSIGSSPIVQVTPQVLTDTYSIGGVTVDHASKNSQAVAEFQGQTMISRTSSQGM